MTTELFLVRHGETSGNLKGLFHGRTDTQLNENGFRQARMVANRLLEFEPIDRVYSSPLQRARLTAEKIAATLNTQLEIEPMLSELDFGDFEGFTLPRLQADHADLFARIMDPEDWDIRFPGGESRQEFHDRIESAIDTMLNRNRGKRIVVVSHLGVIGSIIAQLSGDGFNDWETNQVRNCSLTHLEVQMDRTLVVHCLNDITHLLPTGAE